jgi:peptidoglycan DL-endopeptidase CwlO
VQGETPRSLARLGTLGVAAALLLSLGLGLLLGPAGASPASPGDKPTPTKHQVAVAQAKAQTAARAVGSAQGRLAKVQAELAALNRNAEIAAEAYDGAVYRLGLASQAARQASQRADVAQGQYESAQRIVGTFASAAYRSGANFGSADIFLGVDGPGGAVTRADTLAAVGAQVQHALVTAQSAKIVAGVLRQQASTALGAEQKAEQAVAAAKQRADAAVAAEQSRVASLDAQVAALQHELALARVSASHLVTDRKNGLARALARKLAQERAARERAAREKAARLAAAAEARRKAARQRQSGGGDPSPVVSVGGSAHGTANGAARAIAYARKQLGKPYVYAAAGPGSFDCSGLTMRAWQAGGVSLPHWSVAQYEQSQPVSSSQARPGDLVFYASNHNDYRSIYHVGLYIGGGEMIEAPHTGDVVKIYAVYPNDFFGYARP